MARIRCPNCRATIPVRETPRGGRLTCPECGARVRAGSERPREVEEDLPPPRDNTALWVGLGIGGVLLGLGAAAVAVVLLLGWGPAPVAGPSPSGPSAPPPAATDLPRELFTPPAVLPAFPEDLPPAATITSDPGTVPVLGPDRGRGLSSLASLAGVAALPDGRRCVAVGGDGTVEVWDYGAGRKERQFTVPDARPSSVAVTPDGARLAIGCQDPQLAKFVSAWDLGAGRELWRSEPVKAWGQEVAVSPDGGRVLARTGEVTSGPGRLRIWELGTGKLLKTLEGDGKGRVDRAAWYPNGRQVLLARAGGDGRQAEQVTVWDPETGGEVPFMDLRQKRVVTPLSYWAVSPAGDRLLLRVGQDVLFVDPAKASVLAKVRVQTATWGGAAFSRDGRRALCWGGASVDGRMVDCFVHVLNARTGREVCRLQSPSDFHSAAFSADGKGILAVSRGLAYWPLPD
jgi:hypothetical protein